MWPDLIKKAKDGGLDVIQTYVFWNGHEPSPGKVVFLLYFILFLINLVFLGKKVESFLWVFHYLQYNFEGRFDLVKFIKVVQQAGLYVHLRIGPYVCAEWNFG